MTYSKIGDNDVLIKRLNKIVLLLNKKNHAAGIGPDIDSIQIIVTLNKNCETGMVELKTTYHDHSEACTENSSSRFWDDVSDSFDLQKYVKECLDQLNGK
jgi:hypothetical protein